MPSSTLASQSADHTSRIAFGYIRDHRARKVTSGHGFCMYHGARERQLYYAVLSKPSSNLP